MALGTDHYLKLGNFFNQILAQYNYQVAPIAPAGKPGKIVKTVREYRLQLVDKNRDTSEKLISNLGTILKSASKDISNIQYNAISPNSSKFPSYSFTFDGQKFDLVIGRGANKGENFETNTVTGLATAFSTRKNSSDYADLIQELNESNDDFAKVEIKSVTQRKGSTRKEGVAIEKLGAIIGDIILSATQFVLQDARHAVATLAIFLAAGTRIAPAILRIQQGLLQIKGASSSADLTLKLAEEVANHSIAADTNPALALGDHSNFSAQVLFDNVSFSYPDSKNKILDQVSIRISPGQFVAFVGSSGAGKSTMVDLLLGVLLPDSGDVKISGQAPSIAIEQSPGAIAYVPQDVSIAIGTVRENIALGFPKEFATDERINKTLKISHLDSFVDSLENKADTQVGERGAKLSGGQRQRLGIARAMFTNPKLLVLDEATSSLDAETEASVSAAIQSLRGGTTILMIAHRLATVRSADLVIYIADGQSLAQGTFAEVRAAVPEFDRQANLQGL